MPAVRALAFALWCAASSALARDGAALLRATFDAAPDGFVAGDDPAPVADGALVVDDKTVALARPAWLGDLSLRARVRVDPGAAFTLSLGALVVRASRPADSADVEIELRAEGAALGRARAALDADGVLALDARFRSASVLLSANGGVACGGGAPRPISGGPLSISASGRVRVDTIEVDRLEWSETVRIEGADDERIRALMARPREDFSLDDPTGRGPAPLDPVYAIRVKGDQAPIRVLTCGPRESGGPDFELPALDQALALARIKPWMRVRVYAGPQDQKKELRDAALAGDVVTLAPGEVGVLEISALVGIPGEWPTLTVLDVTERERILDRTVPCGAVGRAVWAELAEETTRVKVIFHLPGLIDVESFYTVRRAPR